MQFIVMPFFGFIAVKIAANSGLTHPMAISLLIITASPGGSYSNWWCSMFNADLALSVTMTAVSTMLSCFFLPANLLLYTHLAFGFNTNDHESELAPEEESIIENLDWKSLFVSITVVTSAIGVGLFLSYKISSPKFNKCMNQIGSTSGILLILASAVLSSGESEARIWDQPLSFYIGVSLPCVAGLIAANLFAYVTKLKKPEAVTVSVECCYQNVGIATTAAVAMYDNPLDQSQALLVPLFYGAFEAILLAFYCMIAWKLGWTKAPRDDPFCMVITKSYEVKDDDDIGGERDENGDKEETSGLQLVENGADSGAGNGKVEPHLLL